MIILGFAVSPLDVKLAPEASYRAVPFRHVILIITIAHINIGLCCSVIDTSHFPCIVIRLFLPLENDGHFDPRVGATSVQP